MASLSLLPSGLRFRLSRHLSGFPLLSPPPDNFAFKPIASNFVNWAGRDLWFEIFNEDASGVELTYHGQVE